MKRDLTQLVECVRTAMADAGVRETTLSVGPFEQPATWEQRNTYLTFCAFALDMGLTIKAEDGPELLHAVVTITNGRA